MSAPAQAPAGVPATTHNAAPAAAPATSSTMSNQNLNQIVTDYLLKRGYTNTEKIFREESKNIGPDGRPIHDESKAMSPKKYGKAFDLLKDWIENNLEIYKFELAKLLWPVFVYSWIELLERNYRDDAKALLNQVNPFFEKYHIDDLRTFATISTPEHIKENPTVLLYRGRKYRVPLNEHVASALFHFLERETSRGGLEITYLLQTYCRIDATARGPIEPFSFEAIHRRAQGADLEDVDVLEGIPGINIGISNKDVLDTSIPLKLGPLPMEEMLREDVRAELEEEDKIKPPAEGRPTLVDEFDRMIKKEESSEGPGRAEVPLPPSRVRDVVIEIQKVRENRDRFKIDGHTGGIGPQVTACMFTFHNTYGTYSCIDMSNDQQLVAAGTMDSYIRVWTIDGKPLKSKNPDEKDFIANNRKLIGHSAPVLSLAFSDAISPMDHNPFGDEGKGAPSVETGPKLLLSASADGHIRLWSLDMWVCLCVYKGHIGPVSRVLWGPHGHYFLSGGWDKTARVWMQDHASAQRLLVGHDTSISAIAWHPNGTYVFTASDETDKSIRMWSVVTGNCVRVFTGHKDYISSLECGPNGKILASADIGGNIFFWDLTKGTRIKRSRGHGKGGIPSMSFSAETTALVSGGLDGTVRIWDVELPAEGHKTAAQQPVAIGAPETTDNATAAAGSDASRAGAAAQGQTQAAATTGATGKKKAKEVTTTQDLISTFPTKKTPVLKVKFTRMNLVVAAGCYNPDQR